jgi:hypothetical protein
MRFYEVDEALSEAIGRGDRTVRVRVAVDWDGGGRFEGVFERDIVEASFYGLKEVGGGTSARGEILLDNPQGIYSHMAGPAYNVTTHHDRAILSLRKEADGDLYRAAVYGRPIVLDLNRACFMKDTGAARQYGTAALNATGSYFSEYEINGKPQYEDWVVRELTKRIQNKREFTVKTHRGLFNARVGAAVRVTTKGETMRGTINAFTFRYRREAAFEASFHITEEGGNERQETLPTTGGNNDQ